MDKFTNLRPIEDKAPEILYDGKFKKVARIDGWEVNINDNDSIVVVPYLEDTMEIVMRREVVPPYRFIDGEDKHLVCVAGSMEDGETAEETLYREVYEETGLVTKTNYDRLKKWRTMFSNKSSTMVYHLFFMPLRQYEYDEVVAPTDGGEMEKLAENVKIHISHINKITPVDGVSSLCIEYLKKELGLK